MDHWRWASRLLLVTWHVHWQGNGTKQGLYSLSGNTSYRQFSWSFGAARLHVIIMASIWNLTAPPPPLPAPDSNTIFKCSSHSYQYRDESTIGDVLYSPLYQVGIGLETLSPLSVAILTDYKSCETPNYLVMSSRLKDSFQMVCCWFEALRTVHMSQRIFQCILRYN